MSSRIKEKYEAKIQQLKVEMKQEFLAQAEKDFDKEFNSLSTVISPSLVAKESREVKKTKKKRRMKGFTKPETLLRPVITTLKEHGPTTKRKLCAEIIKQNNLCDEDLEQHSDGVLRVYKTLDRTRRILVDKGVLETKGGVWKLV
jgi:hypothetical protein